MLELLRQPFPFTTDTAQRVRTALGFGLFVFLFLLTFRPFGLETMKTEALVQATFWYGVVCFGVLLSWFLAMPRLFPYIFRESVWTVWKDILHTLACILAVSGGNILFTHLYFHEAFSGRLVLRFLWWTFAVSIFPVILMVLFRQIRLMKTFGRQAAELDRLLKEAREMDTRQLDTGQTGTQQLEIPEMDIPQMDKGSGAMSGGSETPLPGSPEAFLYAEAADNYVKIFYKDGQELIRSTLKQLEELFRGDPKIFRCHRTYLVNLNKVVHISGNAQGYKLHLEGAEQAIPVSRALNGQIVRLVTRPKTLPVRPSELQKD